MIEDFATRSEVSSPIAVMPLMALDAFLVRAPKVLATLDDLLELGDKLCSVIESIFRKWVF